MNTETRQHLNLALVGPMHPYRGGIAHFLETMYRGLSERGHRVDAVTFTRQYPGLLFPGKTQYVEEPQARPVPAVRMLDTINPLSWYRTARYLVDRQPDAIIYKYWMPFFGPAFGTITRYARRHGIPSIVNVDNALPHERRPGDVMLGRFFLNACDSFLVMSESVERDLRSMGIRGPVRSAPHPTYDLFGKAVPKDEARHALHLPEDAPVLLFFGFVRRYKGLHVLLEALPQVLKELPNARLVVAGAFYDDEESYRTLLSEHGLDEHVHLHAGYIPDEIVPRYFSAADAVVQPYLSATQSGVAQIAFHFDKPVITTDVGGLAEIVPDGQAGLVVPPEDAPALARAVIRFFQDDMAEQLAAGVRAEKAKYSWDRFYDAIEELARRNG